MPKFLLLLVILLRMRGQKLKPKMVLKMEM